MTAASKAIQEVLVAADGQLVGRTRLQKTVYVLELCGLGYDFHFHYKYYGPYSEDLTLSVKDAELDGLVKESEEIAQWGGHYSIFSLCERPSDAQVDQRAIEIVKLTKRSDPVTLELAATAAFLKLSGVDDFWAETKKRKPQKATAERIAKAKSLWSDLKKVDVPQRLPDI